MAKFTNLNERDLTDDDSIMFAFLKKKVLGEDRILI
jgi:hypothetical protein